MVGKYYCKDCKTDFINEGSYRLDKNLHKLERGEIKLKIEKKDNKMGFLDKQITLKHVLIYLIFHTGIFWILIPLSMSFFGLVLKLLVTSSKGNAQVMWEQVKNYTLF